MSRTKGNRIITVLTASVLLAVIGPGGARAQESTSVGAAVHPELSLPLGARAMNYQMGYGARLESVLAVPAARFLAPTVEVGYGIVPLPVGGTGLLSSSNLSLIRGGLGVKAALPVVGTLSAHARATGFGFYGLLRGDSEGESPGLGWSAGTGVGLQLTSRLMLEVGAAYTSYAGLHDGITISLGVISRVFGPGSVAVPGEVDFETGPRPMLDSIRFSDIELLRVFPALFKYYDTRPIGTVTVANTGEDAVQNVEVRLMLKQYMDAPKLSARIDELAPGERRDVELYALFTEDILEITEGARLAAELVAEYAVDDRSGSHSEVVTLEAFDRNAMQWDDDRKVAAFVTARDEQVQVFARNVASAIRESRLESINREFQLAIALLASMDAHGCTYVIDPSSSYAELSANPLAIDAVQFPRQTLQFRAGDCDDLSVAYAAMLESVGIPTAFITVPGHIYLAFGLTMSEREAAGSFSRLDDLILRDDGTVWVPVETTILNQGFMKAWATGAQQWRRYSERAEAGFFPTEEAWTVYEPVAFSVSTYEVPAPSHDRLIESFRAELDQFVEREIQQREQPLVGRLERSPSNPRTRNRLGVLYAQFGRIDEAVSHFEVAVSDREYAPALANLGNVALLRGDLPSAERYFSRSIAADPDNVSALVGIARVRYDREDFDGAQETFEEIERIDPEVSRHVSYLGRAGAETGRATDRRSAVDTVFWGE